MAGKKITISFNDKKAIEKLDSLKHSKGKYIERLILKDIQLDLLEKRVDKLEGEKT